MERTVMQYAAFKKVRKETIYCISMRPLRSTMYSVQRAGTQLVFLNKIKRLTAHNNSDNKGRGGQEGSDRQGGV